MVGRQLSHYRILEKLGEGGMGEVYLAEDTKLGRKIALKILPEAMAADPERLERFQREARSLAALDHPNIVTVYSVEEAEGQHFLTMGLIEGQRLDDEIPPNGLPLDRLFDLAIPLCDGLAAAHDKGIAHRDLKPANVMLTTAGRVKVVDFGLAKVTGQAAGTGETATAAMETREGVVVGTAPYMSPEQVQGKPVDHRTDIFSLGVLLYQLATGQQPFQGENTASVVSSILRDAPDPVNHVRGGLPNHLGRVIHRCLEKDPEKRFQTAKDVRNELEGLRREVDSGSYSSGSMPAAAPAPAAGKSWWPAVAVVVVLALAAMWWSFRDRGRDAERTAPAEASQADAAASAIPRVVVLPFENLGAADDEYFASGMTEEITSKLAAVSGLGVISRTSAFQYDRSGKTTKQIGEDFGVDYVLEGTVRWASGSRVRINPQLVRASDDTSVWSESFDQVIDDVFEVQSEIAGKVAAQLGVALLEPEEQQITSQPTDNSEAYQAYLRGLHQSRTSDSTQEAIELALGTFDRTVQLDPDFALAWAELSRQHSAMHHFGYDRTEARQEMARRAAERALAIAPDLPEAHLAKGYYHYWALKDYEPALAEFAIAEKSLSGSAELHAATAYVYRRQGRWEESAASLLKAVDLSPVEPEARRNLAETYTYLRRYADAERFHEQAVSLAPHQVESIGGLSELHWTWRADAGLSRAALERLPRGAGIWGAVAWFTHEFYSGNYDDALERLELHLSDVYSSVGIFRPIALLAANAHDQLGNTDRARQAYESARALLEAELAQRPADFRLHAALGRVLAGLGRKDEAIRAGRRAVELYPVSRDALTGTVPVRDLALIYAKVGERDLALEQIEYLLSTPSRLSVNLLRVDPRWAPLRDDPRFEALLARYAH